MRFIGLFCNFQMCLSWKVPFLQSQASQRGSSWVVFLWLSSEMTCCGLRRWWAWPDYADCGTRIWAQPTIASNELGDLGNRVENKIDKQIRIEKGMDFLKESQFEMTILGIYIKNMFCIIEIHTHFEGMIREVRMFEILQNLTSQW